MVLESKDHKIVNEKKSTKPSNPDYLSSTKRIKKITAKPMNTTFGRSISPPKPVETQNKDLRYDLQDYSVRSHLFIKSITGK